MDLTSALFYVFSAVLLLAALQVITARNPVHAALFLVLTFFTAAGIWLLLKAEFLAIVLVLVYVGAVMVLFLFVVMMLDINLDQLREGFWGRVPLAAVVGLAIALEMSAVLLKGFLRPDSAVHTQVVTVGNTKQLGLEIFTHYTWPFEIAAAILFLAIVAAVALTLRRRKDSKYFDPAAAVKVKRADRVRLVSMKAVSDRASAAEKTGA